MIDEGQIIDLEGMRFRLHRHRPWGKDRRCAHQHMTIDEHGGTVSCDDCTLQLSPIWALNHILDQYQRAQNRASKAEERLHGERNVHLHTLAAKKLEDAWRKRSTVPMCPHCNRGILPTDGLGSARMSRSIELRRRQVEQAQRDADPPPPARAP